MRKLLLCVTLLLPTSARVLGQTEGAAPPSPFGAAEAARLLKSEGNRERAWGAYLAGAHGLKEQSPLVAGLLEDPNVVSGGWEEALVRQAALDALIRLDAEVPAEKLLPLYGASPDEVIILLSRAPKQNERELLSLFAGDMPDARWNAVGNLLVEARPAGFAAQLLRGLKMWASVYVYDSEGERGYNGGCGGGSGGGCGPYNAPEGFPPVGYYSLGTVERRGAVVFAPGRRTVYYLRTLSRGRCGGGFGQEWESRDARRVEYIAELLGTTAEELKLEAYSSRDVVCQDARQCRRALAAVRDEVGGGYTEAVKRLLDAELLDPAEAAELKPDITLHLYDERERRSFPLPSKLKGVTVELSAPEADPPAESAGPTTDAPR